MNTVQANINNLTSLWRTVGERAQAHFSKEHFEFNAIDYSEWPNRLWFHQDPNDNQVKSAKETILAQTTKLVIPNWNTNKNLTHQLMEKNGFEKLSEQIGMSLQLNQTYPEPTDIQMKKVGDETSAKLWEQLFRQAFNYTISHQLILSSCDKIDYLIAYHQNKAVGTAALFYTGDVAGIHSMGIIPEMRRKGFAEKMMLYMLNQAVDRGCQYATLQASNMGKGLYLKLGFIEEFILENYAFPNH